MWLAPGPEVFALERPRCVNGQVEMAGTDRMVCASNQGGTRILCV